ncbi:MAG: hypothetical protein JWM82_2420, partial [Myxococcales bacterium]|nr:hypothetical protein [Myxococcales bacterium]
MISADPRRPFTVGMYSPGWPPETMQNGIVTYVANLRPCLEREGMSVRVLTAEVPPGPVDPMVRLVRARPPRAVRGLVRKSADFLGF